MRLRLFTYEEIAASLSNLGIRVCQVFGVHIFTNLVPSTILSNTGYSKMNQSNEGFSKNR